MKNPILFTFPSLTKYQLLFAALLVIFIVFPASSVNAQCPATSRIYVNMSVIGGTGDGSTWANAYPSVGEAIWDAIQCSSALPEIWVAAGTYNPVYDPLGSSSPADPRDKTFYIQDGLKLFGGFAGTETSLAQRTPASVTILSGDFNNDDVVSGIGSTLSITGNTENAYHVIMSVKDGTSTTIDGITVRGGNASLSADLIVEGTTVKKNLGAGMANYSSSPAISNCTFSGNASYSGGGIYFNGASTPALSNCVIGFNRSNTTGGGIFFNSSTPVLTNCLISGNRSTTLGGGIYISSSVMSLVNCNLNQNVGTDGGGIANVSGNVTFINGVFNSNISSRGGAIYAYNATTTISNASIKSNSSTSNGGAFYSTMGTTSITNSFFSTNTSAANGGATYIASGTTTITNCTFNLNRCTSSGNGGGLWFQNNTNGSVTNCILWNNSTQLGSGSTREEIYRAGATLGTLTVSYNIIRDLGAGTGTNIALGSGNTNADPLFVNVADPDGTDDIFGTADDGLVTGNCSPAQDAGLNSAVPGSATTDIKGDARIQQIAVDLGAYEAATPVTNVSTTTITSTSQSSSTLLGPGIAYFAGDCTRLIAALQANGESPVAGSVTANVYIQGTAPLQGSQRYVRRYYDISPAANADVATASITLYFTQEDFNDYNANNGTEPDMPTGSADVVGISNLKIAQHHGVSTSGNPGSYTGWAGAGPDRIAIDPADNNIVWNATAARWEVTINVTGFSGFFANANLNAALPVKLQGFTAQNTTTQANRINWNTSIESPGTLFEISRSRNGIDFSKIGMVNGTGDHSSYVFYDDLPLTGENYYRLNISEIDGVISYSKIVVVRNSGKKSSVAVWPVPASSTITITNTDAKLDGNKILILDVQGRVVTRFTLEKSTRINVSSWAMGIYSFRLPGGEVIRIVRQ